MRITLRELESKGAYQGQVDLFKELGLHKRKINLQDCLEHAGEIDWDWAAENLLSDPARAEFNLVYDKAWAEYHRVCDSAWDEFNRVRDQALDEFNRACAEDEFNRVCDLAGAEYGRVCDPAWNEFNRVQASTFFRLKESEQRAAPLEDK